MQILLALRINLAENHGRMNLGIYQIGISIQLEGDYPEITSFDLNGASKYMTSKSGQLYKSNEGNRDSLWRLCTKLSGFTLPRTRRVSVLS